MCDTCMCTCHSGGAARCRGIAAPADEVPYPPKDIGPLTIADFIRDFSGTSFSPEDLARIAVNITDNEGLRAEAEDFLYLSGHFRATLDMVGFKIATPGE